MNYVLNFFLELDRNRDAFCKGYLSHIPLISFMKYIQEDITKCQGNLEIRIFIQRITNSAQKTWYICCRISTIVSSVLLCYQKLIIVLSCCFKCLSKITVNFMGKFFHNHFDA